MSSDAANALRAASMAARSAVPAAIALSARFMPWTASGAFAARRSARPSTRVADSPAGTCPSTNPPLSIHSAPPLRPAPVKPRCPLPRPGSGPFLEVVGPRERLAGGVDGRTIGGARGDRVERPLHALDRQRCVRRQKVRQRIDPRGEFARRYEFVDEADPQHLFRLHRLRCQEQALRRRPAEPRRIAPEAPFVVAQAPARPRPEHAPALPPEA